MLVYDALEIELLSKSRLAFSIGFVAKIVQFFKIIVYLRHARVKW